jgi:hypothetical protein
MKFHIDHRFENCTLERFIAVYFSEDFNNKVAKISGLRTRDLVEERVDDAGRRHRRVRMHPAVTLPGAIKKWVSEEQIHYDEVAVFDPKTNTVTYRIDSKANDRVRFEGTIRFVTDGAAVRRIIDSEVEIKAPFGVGTLIEKFIEGEVQKGYEKIRPFLQGYINDHPGGPPDAPPPVTT